MGEAGTKPVDGPPKGHPSTAPGPDTDAPPGGRHPNDPGMPTEKVLLDYMLGTDGPDFIWRDKSKAYSKRDGLLYTTQMFRLLCSSRPVLDVILGQSDEISSTDKDLPRRKKYDAANSVASRCHGPVFLKILEGLEEQADADGITKSAEADLVDHLKAAVTQPHKFEIEVGQSPMFMSVLAYAESRYVGSGSKWLRVGNLAAWVQRGPRIAIRPDFLSQFLGLKKSGFKSRSAGLILRNRGVITMNERIDSGTKVWFVREDWLAREFDMTILDRDEQPELAIADVKKVAAGDKDKDDEPIPF